MAITRVGASQGTSTASVISTTGLSLTRTPTAIGNLLIVAAATNDRTQPILISDTAGNTWVPLNADFNDATNGTRLASWYAFANGTGSTTVTVKSTSVNFGFWSETLEEFTATHASAPTDQVNQSAAGASGTNPTGTAITLGADDCLVWSYMVDAVTNVGAIDGSSATAGSDDGASDWTEHRILVGRSGVSVAAAWTSSGSYNYFIASIKPPAGGRRFLLGRH